jgi:O-acetyl-ADP-ribose deacetylase (regulator of RNase III)
MIKITNGNLLTADAEALVNTVNCVGFMGKGIALQFKQAFPWNNKLYEAACRAGEVEPGKMLIYDNGGLRKPHYIINFPTKRHWRGNSQISDIEIGLDALTAEVRRLNIRSVAVPPLGCGLGGLDWGEVRPMIEKAFSELPDVCVLLYEPKGAPPAREMQIGTNRPAITPSRALFIKLMSAYATLEYSQTLLEVQKLAYFLQESGEPMRLKYEAGTYGPFAANLYKVLEIMEGHFIRGYGDNQKPGTELQLLPGAVEVATEFLADRRASLERLGAVSELIEGFETPYGMELLASVHWVAKYGGPKHKTVALGAEAAIEQVHAWNPRKKQIFKPIHVRTAWSRLESMGWIEKNTEGPEIPPLIRQMQ